MWVDFGGLSEDLLGHKQIIMCMQLLVGRPAISYFVFRIRIRIRIPYQSSVTCNGQYRRHKKGSTFFPRCRS